MKKIVLIIIFIAMVWQYVSRKVEDSIKESDFKEVIAIDSIKTNKSIDDILAKRPVYKVPKKDPFQSSLYSEHVVKRSNNTKVNAAIIALPEISISTILPGANPVVILKHNNASKPVRVGDMAWGAKVVSITGTAVTLSYQGKKFVVKK